MPTTQVKLWFQQLQDLWQFAQRIGATQIVINTDECSLVCYCSESDIALAVDASGARKPGHQKASA